MCVHSVVFSSFSDLFYGWSIERKQHTCYVALTRTLDSHDVTRGRGSLEEVLGGVQLGAARARGGHHLGRALPAAHAARAGGVPAERDAARDRERASGKATPLTLCRCVNHGENA